MISPVATAAPVCSEDARDEAIRFPLPPFLIGDDRGTTGTSIPILDRTVAGRVLRPSTFRRLAVLATVFACAQISLGAAVRVSGSGIGCGNDWPLCRGHIVPPANTRAIIEYAHRSVGSLTGVLLILTVVVGWLTFRRSQPLVIWLVTAAAGLIVLEGLLGALVD